MVYAAALPAMSLLTPTESNAFQSFLSSMDSYSDSFMAPEWNVYGEVSETPGKETLAKATKDLMSLDAVKWGNPPRSAGLDEHSPQSLIQNGTTSPHTLFSYIKQQQSRHQQTSNDSHRPQSPSITIAPHRTVSAPSPPHADDVPSASSSPASIPMSASPPTPYEYYPPQPPVPLANSKRPSQDDTHNSSNKRPRPSHASSSSSSNSAPAPKPALLSPSQKKANHIQSEQKRRANIRRGYEALCDTVPALREAIRLEDEACGSGAGTSSAGNSKQTAASKGKKKGRGKIMSDDGEKIDGRAGPRSENVVLQKTIDHIQDLLQDRQDLLTRLNASRNSLARGHPILSSDGSQPLWEREWTGGGSGVDEEEDDDDDE